MENEENGRKPKIIDHEMRTTWGVANSDYDVLIQVLNRLKSGESFEVHRPDPKNPEAKVLWRKSPSNNKKRK